MGADGTRWNEQKMGLRMYRRQKQKAGIKKQA